MRALPVIPWGRLFTVHSEKAQPIFSLFLRLQCQPLHSPYEHNSQLLIRCRLITNFPRSDVLFEIYERYFKYFLISEGAFHSKEGDGARLQTVATHGTCSALPFQQDLCRVHKATCIYCWLPFISEHYLREWGFRRPRVLSMPMGSRLFWMCE